LIFLILLKFKMPSKLRLSVRLTKVKTPSSWIRYVGTTGLSLEMPPQFADNERFIESTVA
jgi:hypothetical protein